MYEETENNDDIQAVLSSGVCSCILDQQRLTVSQLTLCDRVSVSECDRRRIDLRRINYSGSNTAFIISLLG